MKQRDDAPDCCSFINRVLEGDPDGESSWFLLAVTLKELLLPEASESPRVEHPYFPIMIHAFDRLIDLNPDEPTHRWNRAMIRQAIGQTTQAVDDLRCFLARFRAEHATDVEDYKSWRASALNHLGCNLMSIGKMEEALENLVAAVDHNPHYVCAWEDLSNAYDILGDPESAAYCLEQALAYAPPVSLDDVRKKRLDNRQR